MILSFSVANYKSYLRKQRISFVATRLSRHKDNLVQTKRGRILRASLIYGANATGKSNLLHAINFSTQAIISGLTTLNTENAWFRLSNNHKTRIGCFTYQIQLGEERYAFQIQIDYIKKEFKRESLWRITHNHGCKRIYDRIITHNGDTHTVMPSEDIDPSEKTRLQVYLEDYSHHPTEKLRKQTILSDLASRSNNSNGLFKEFGAIYNWFKHIIIISPKSHYILRNQLANQTSKRELFLTMLDKFHTGITGIKKIETPIEINALISLMNPKDPIQAQREVEDAITNKRNFSFKTKNNVLSVEIDDSQRMKLISTVLHHGDSQEQFLFQDESTGTQRLFDLIPILDPATSDYIFFIDEIESSLHPILVYNFVKAFLEMKKGTTCQLIATTHNSLLMDLQILRQDQIWFVQRLSDYSSHLYPLTAYNERFDLRVNRNFLSGKYEKRPS